jgi:hypothetical protein
VALHPRHLGSDGVFADASRRGIDFQRVVEFCQSRLRDGGFAHMQGAPVALAEGSGDALLDGEHRAQTGPRGVLARRLQLEPDRLHQLIRQDGDEQMPLGAVLFMVEHRAQPEFGLEAAEHRLEIGEHGIGVPQPFGVPAGFVGAQAVDAGMGEHGALARDFHPGHGGGVGAGFVRGDGDVVMLGGAAAFFLQPADALVDGVELFLTAGFGQRRGDPAQAGLESRAEAIGHRGFLGLAAGGVAVKPDFSAVLAEHALQPDGLLGGGEGFDRLRGIELAGAGAADDEVAVTPVLEPGDVGLCRYARVHDDQCAGRGTEPVQHLGQRAALGHVAREHLRPAHEPAAVEHQAECDERAIGPLFLGTTAGCLGVFRRGGLEIGVGEVVEGDGDRNAEQVLDAGKQCVLNGGAVFDQQVGGSEQAHRREGFEVHVEQFAEAGALAQPVPGG